MSDQAAASTGLTMLCCIILWPFVSGLLIGWQFHKRWSSGGWLGLLPRWIKDHIEIEE